MANKKFLLVVLAIMLALGMTVAGCNKGSKADSKTAESKTADNSKTAESKSSSSSGSNSDGWTEVTRLPLGYNRISTIAWGNDKFVAGGRVFKNFDGKIMYSSDGITWTAANTGSIFDNAGDVDAIAWGKDKFVAVGSGGGDGKIAYSSDGVTWTAVSNSPFGMDTVTWGNNMFVAIGGSNIAYSSDGVTWTAVDVSKIFSGNSGRIDAIAYGGGTFVAIGSSGNSSNMSGKIATSKDGISWTAVTTTDALKVEGSPYPAHINAIAWGNGTFVAVGEQGKMAASKDGTSWTAINVSKIFDDTINLIAIAYGNNRFIASGYRSGVNKTATSTNGTTWTAVDYSSIFGKDYNAITAIGWGKGKFVVGIANQIWYSTGK